MENASGGSDHRRDHRRDAASRRKTVSGPIPNLHHATDEQTTSPEAMRLPWNSPSQPSSPNGADSTSSTSPRSILHRRTLSNNLLARFSFFRATNEDGRPTSPQKDRPSSRDKESKSPTKSLFSRKSMEDELHRSPPVSPTKGENVMAAVLKASKTRKRKGSLRKTALLGTRRAAPEGRERKSSFSLLQRPNFSRHEEVTTAREDIGDFKDGAGETGLGLQQAHLLTSSPPVPRDYQRLERPVTASSSDSSWSGPSTAAADRLSLFTNQKAQMRLAINEQSTTNGLGSPLDVKSPTSQASYSTTDDDDVLTFDRPAKTFPVQSSAVSGLNAPLSSAATSYFPPPSESSLKVRPRRTAKHSSPLSHSTPVTPYTEPEPHDYTETEYWGWVILFVTWLTFTVGMGSCLEIWSWAWNVGYKPYAPPELQDDSTLPIVGYYPALIVLVGVVAWVWITIAWVGMKYFRHAKIEV